MANKWEEAHKDGYNAGVSAKSKGIEMSWANAEYSYDMAGYNRKDMAVRTIFMRAYQEGYLAKDESK